MRRSDGFIGFVPFAVAIGIALVIFLNIDKSDAELLRIAKIAVGIVAAGVGIQILRAALRWNTLRSARPPAPSPRWGARTQSASTDSWAIGADPSASTGFMIGDTGAGAMEMDGGASGDFGDSSSDCGSSDSGGGDCGGGDSGGGS